MSVSASTMIRRHAHPLIDSDFPAKTPVAPRADVFFWAWLSAHVRGWLTFP